MDFLKSLLPAEWSMRFFEPETDTEPGAHIYLHIPVTDTIFQFRQNVSRYDVVEFIKELHDEPTDTRFIIESASRLFMLNTILTDKETNQLLDQLEPFRKQSAIFIGDSTLEIEHDKTDDGAWVTSITKHFGTGPSDKPVAVINNSEYLATEDI